MASLDDSIISDRNLMLLDNVTNYNRVSVDYFHHDFNYSKLEMSNTWVLLLKMRKHKILRLPSCSAEDDDDYARYLQRLHHCLWRRWAIHDYHLDNIKIDPISINWSKETDVTVLYGPSLSATVGGTTELIEEGKKKKENNNSQKLNLIEDQDQNYDSDNDNYSSSVNSRASSIFDSPSILKTTSKTSIDSEPTKKKSLKFNYIVARRDIDRFGNFIESDIRINDMDEFIPKNISNHHFHNMNFSRQNQDSFSFNNNNNLINQSKSYNNEDYFDCNSDFDDDDDAFFTYSPLEGNKYIHNSHLPHNIYTN